MFIPDFPSLPCNAMPSFAKMTQWRWKFGEIKIMPAIRSDKDHARHHARIMPAIANKTRRGKWKMAINISILSPANRG